MDLMWYFTVFSDTTSFSEIARAVRPYPKCTRISDSRGVKP